MKIFAGVVVVCAILLPVMAVRRGAPPPLAATFESPEALAIAVLDGFARRDAGALRRLALTEDEFRAHIWPELPVSRPERNMPFDYVWQDLQAKSRGYLAGNLRRPLPAAPRLARVVFDGHATEHPTFTILRDSRLVIVDTNGSESSLRLFGSVVRLRNDGRYKLFSFVTD